MGRTTAHRRLDSQPIDRFRPTIGFMKMDSVSDIKKVMRGSRPSEINSVSQGHKKFNFVYTGRWDLSAGWDATWVKNLISHCQICLHGIVAK